MTDEQIRAEFAAVLDALTGSERRDVWGAAVFARRLPDTRLASYVERLVELRRRVAAEAATQRGA